MKFVDIGANLLDGQFLHGIYRDKFQRTRVFPIQSSPRNEHCSLASMNSF